MAADQAPKTRPPSFSTVEMTQLVLPGDTNALGTAFGGTIFGWVDVAAAVAAQRHSGGTVVTASIDSLHFINPVQLGNVVVLRASVNRAWRSSMEVGVHVECEATGRHEDRVHAASAYLTFVAVDDRGRPRPVPSIAPETDAERRRFDEAADRRALRLKERRR
jgi:acyl-CoA hydrolase